MNTENHYQETDLGNISLNPRGEYSPEESYEYLDLVVFEGGSYICLTDTAITGISPESGKTTQYWQVITIPGDMTPEYIAMHDRVVNLSEQVGADAEEVRTAEQNISGIEENITQMQEYTRQSAESAEQSKDSAAGYAASADASRRAAEESEQNINAQVTGFDSHVAEKTSEAESDIEAARINANAAVVAQQKESIQEVKDQTAPYIAEKQKAAEQAIEKKAEEYDTSVDADIQAVKDAGNAQIQNVNSAGNTQVGNVNSAGANQIAAVESAGTAQKKKVESAGATQVQAVKDEGAAQVTNVQAAAQEITGKVEQIGQNTQGVAGLKQDIKELSDKKITKFYASNLGNTTLNDSDDGKITDMMVYGKGFQQTYTGKNLFDYINTHNSFVERNILNDGTIEDVNGTSDKRSYSYGNSEYKFSLSAGTYILTVDIKSPSAETWGLLNCFDDSGYNIFNLNVFNDKSFVGKKTLTFVLNKDTNVGFMLKPLKAKFTIQLEKGSKATSYEPYVGGIPSPNPDYPQEIQSVVNPVVTVSDSDGTNSKSATLPYTLNAIPVSSGGNITIDGKEYIADYVDVENKKLVRMVDSSKFDTTVSIVDNMDLLLSTPTTIDLTDEEVQAFKDLATYYPTTNVSVASDQLDGYTTFNYPLNMKNGWDYIMQQLEETRPIIYDTEVQVLENRIDTAILMAMMEG